MRIFPVEAPPEELAYGMAKYSRSAKSLEENLAEVSAEKAGKFLETFYHKYGHASIADMAHVPLAIEDISILAAIQVVDEPLWDGQERSTRYQDFSTPRYYVPPDADPRYVETCEMLFRSYRDLTAELIPIVSQRFPPGDIPEKQYQSTIRARVFDVTRGLLPLATLTSLGQITSARTIEKQVRRLLASPFPEVQDVGWGIRDAALQLTPTLVKYIDIDTYRVARDTTLGDYLDPLMSSALVPNSVVAHPPPQNLLLDVAATLLYRYSRGYSYRDCWEMVLKQSNAREIVDLALANRGKHDDWPREFRSGGLIFDITCDIGAFRDLHRHRRCTQIIQDFPTDSFQLCSVPVSNLLDWSFGDRFSEGVPLGWRDRYERAILEAQFAAAHLGTPYLLPLQTETRFLMKMDLGELGYIAELRTKPSGMPSYRRIAHQMWEQAKRFSPWLLEKVRVTDPAEGDVLAR